MRFALLAALSLTACGRDTPPAPPTAPTMELPTEDILDLAPVQEGLAAAVPLRFVEGGYVAPRRGGAVDIEGDSLLWTGLAIGTLPCGAAAALVATLDRSTTARGGALLRYDLDPDGPIDPRLVGDENTRDGFIGAIFGLTSAARRCPELADTIGELWRRIARFVDDEGHGALYPGNLHALVTPGMRFLLDLASHALAGGARPSGEALLAFEAGEIPDALRITVGHAACYPLHLAALGFAVAAREGRPIHRAVFEGWCGATAGTDIPMIDWMCRRAAARTWLVAEPDGYEHRHQRCSPWESPDLDAGEESPRVDWLELYEIARGR